MVEIQSTPIAITPAPDSPIMLKIEAGKKKYKSKCCKKYKKGKQCKRCPKLRACCLPKAFQEENLKL